MAEFEEIQGAASGVMPEAAGAGTIRVRLPSGDVMEVPQGTTLSQLAARIGPRLARKAVAGKVNERVVGLETALNQDAEVVILTPESPEGLEVLRHSTAHLMAQALLRLRPGTKLAIGPPIDSGFYYDVDPPEPLSAEELPKIEEEMRRIVAEDLPILREEMSREQAIEFYRQRGEPYKVEILEGIEEPKVSFYRQGEFIDLCRGPHVPSTGRLGAFKLLNLAGAYWRGDSTRPQLTRIYGTAFADGKSLQEHLKRLEEAARRDHRKLGRELDLFSFREEAPGFVFWHAKGWTLYRTLEAFSRELQQRRGYLEVRTPWIFRSALWERSGHWGHFRQNMFVIPDQEGGEPMAVKPMNCPGHCLLFKQEVRSYRDLPLKIAEYGPLARLEASGTLHGALRVRGMHQDDAHLFIREDQITEQVLEVIGLVDETYRTFGMPYHVKLATRPENFMGEPATWERAEKALAGALKAAGLPYGVNPGEGAFYGPKLEFYATDAIGREWQCATVQLDFQMPIRFDLTYVGEDGQRYRPVMIHRAIMGTLERFIAILVEHYAGAFPVWLAPVQARVLPVSDSFLEYARSVHRRLLDSGLRSELDERNEKLGYKIREAQLQKVPYMLVVGQKEAESGTAAVRHRSRGDLGAMEVGVFIDQVSREVAQRLGDAQEP